MINYKLKEKDVDTFYRLYLHKSEVSNNFGVVGSKLKFNAIKKIIKTEYNNTQFKVIESKNKITVMDIINDAVIHYIHIRNIKDLKNKKFYRYI